MLLETFFIFLQKSKACCYRMVMNGKILQEKIIQHIICVNLKCDYFKHVMDVSIIWVSLWVTHDKRLVNSDCYLGLRISLESRHWTHCTVGDQPQIRIKHEYYWECGVVEQNMLCPKCWLSWIFKFVHQPLFINIDYPNQYFFSGMDK